MKPGMVFSNLVCFHAGRAGHHCLPRGRRGKLQVERPQQGVAYLQFDAVLAGPAARLGQSCLREAGTAGELAALLLHRSQMPPAEHLDQAIRSVAADHAAAGAAYGYPGLTYAEAFRKVFTGHASRMRTDGQKVPA